jgi:hypothetical protein
VTFSFSRFRGFEYNFLDSAWASVCIDPDMELGRFIIASVIDENPQIETNLIGMF